MHNYAEFQIICHNIMYNNHVLCCIGCVYDYECVSVCVCVCVCVCVRARVRAHTCLLSRREVSCASTLNPEFETVTSF